MSRPVLSLAFAAVLGLGVVTQASATPILGIQLAETGYTTVSTTSTSDPLVFNSAFGTFSVNVEVNNLVMDPLSIDLGSTNLSSTTAGTLVITASATDLTSPIGLTEFLSQFSGNFGGSVSSVSLQTYIDTTNTMFGTNTALDSLSVTTTPFATSSTDNATTVNPFAVTEVLTITTGGQANLSLDGSIAVVPEPTSLALLGMALIAFGLIQSRRKWTIA